LYFHLGSPFTSVDSKFCVKRPYDEFIGRRQKSIINTQASEQSVAFGQPTVWADSGEKMAKGKEPGAKSKLILGGENKVGIY